jgi:hypothetical protein
MWIRNPVFQIPVHRPLGSGSLILNPNPVKDPDPYHFRISEKNQNLIKFNDLERYLPIHSFLTKIYHCTPYVFHNPFFGIRKCNSGYGFEKTKQTAVRTHQQQARKLKNLTTGVAEDANNREAWKNQCSSRRENACNLGSLNLCLGTGY